jgi:hypothetical protein
MVADSAIRDMANMEDGVHTMECRGTADLDTTTIGMEDLGMEEVPVTLEDHGMGISRGLAAIGMVDIDLKTFQ